LPDFPNLNSAIEDFQSARQKATVEGILARLQGKSNRLLSFDEVAKKLKLQARSDRGTQTIPLDAIVGSVGRYTDFTRTFLPRNADDKDRWVRVKATLDDLESSGFPPIDVYKVSDVYFVLDGNHRVSVARQEGWESIQANVIEVKSNVPLSPDTQPDELIVKAEYAEFLDETQINEKRPNVDLSVTVPGQYEKLRQQIQIHRYYAVVDKNLDLSFEEALLDWYDNIYIPLAEAIRDRGLMRWFPDRTITDFYLWVTEHRDTLQDELGWNISAETVAGALASTARKQKTGAWRKSKLMERYTERLFKDILVPLSGDDSGWEAMQQAILIAQREGSTLLGLHVENNKDELDTPQSRAMQERFNESCQQANVKGMLAMEVGEPGQKILERSLLTDLVVLKVSYPPLEGFSGLASPLRAIIANASGPVLAIPGKSMPTTHALLAYDGSSRAKEALFLATYLAEQWKISLSVFTALENKKLRQSIQDEARNYLEFHEIKAEFILKKGAPDTVRQIIRERKIDLIVMGGYSGSAIKEVFIGSNVNRVLRESSIPALICR
jgi:nucleotide-binding universal stress UspA family protein